MGQPVSKSQCSRIEVGFVRVYTDQLSRSKNRCGKQNGELPFFGHWESPQIDLNAGRGRSPDSTSAFPEMPESAPHDQFTCSGKELQPDSKCFGTETLTINYSRPGPQVTARGFDKDARIRRPRPFG